MSEIIVKDELDSCITFGKLIEVPYCIPINREKCSFLCGGGVWRKKDPRCAKGQLFGCRNFHLFRVMEEEILNLSDSKVQNTS